MSGFLISDICPELCATSPGSPSRSDYGSMPSTPQTDYSSCEENTPKRPNVSFSAMIMTAIARSPGKRLTVTEIYEFIMRTWPYYANLDNNRWQNSVRHTLSSKTCFVRCPREFMKSKGCFWALNSNETINVQKGKLITRRALKNREKWLESIPNRVETNAYPWFLERIG